MPAMSSYQKLKDRVARLENELLRQKRFHDISNALFQISDAIITTSDLEALYQSIHRSLSSIIDTTNFLIALYDASDDSVTFPYCIDSVDPCYPPVIEISKTESLTAEVIRTGHPLLIGKADIVRRRLNSCHRVPDCTPSEIWLGAPLKTPYATIGVMAVQSYTDANRYDATDMDVLAAVADQVAMAIERKRAETALLESETRLKAFFEASFEAIFLSEKGICLDQNEAAERMFGYSRSEAIGRPGTEWIAPQDRAIVAQHIQSGYEKPYEVNALRKDGTMFACEIQGRMIEHQARSIRVTALRDVSERKRAEAALRESEDKMRSIFRAAPVGIGLVSNRKLLEVNKQVCRMTGYTEAELLGKNARILYPDDQEYQFVGTEKYRQISKHGTGTVETRFLRKDGRIINVLMSSTPLDPANLSAGVTFAALDITERKEAEKALRESEEKYRLLVENQSDLVVKVDPEGRFLFVSPSYCKLFGKSEQELLNRRFMPLVHEEDRESTAKEMEKLFSPPYSAYMEQRAMTRNGWRWLGWQDSAVLDKDRKVAAVIGIGRDITERVEVQRALKESEEKFRTLVEKSPFGISLIDKDGRYKYVNPQFSLIFGYTLADTPTGKAWFARAFPDRTYRAEVIKTWIGDQKECQTGQARPRTYAVTCKDGSRKDIYFLPVTMENRSQFVIYEDITEKTKLARQLQQVRKFEAIGTLAGGVAHDFNNLLMGIQGRSSLMAIDLDPAHPHREHLEAIQAYIQSATELTRQLLGFARGGKYEVKPIDVDDLVRHSARMFGRTKKEIDIHIKEQAAPTVVEADRSQIEQVLMNLYVNAWQAMPEGGDLYLEVKTVVLDDDYCRPHDVSPGRYARISVTDTGIGMDDATRQRVFDPFFTTKEKGRGTGMGLASSYGIIKNHGGLITVYSEVGHGTTFAFYLPISEKAVHVEAHTEGRLAKGTGTILLVDDEEMIIEVGKAMLERLGYRPIVSRSGMEAVETVAEKGRAIDLVLLDMIMPGMDGGKTFDRIRDVQPAMPIILSSGYAMNGKAEEIMRRGCNGFIQKPFNLVELSEKLRHVLDAAKANGSSRDRME